MHHPLKKLHLLNFKNRYKIRPRLSKHYLGTIVCKDASKLIDNKDCIDIVQSIVEKHGAKCIGKVMYEFPNKSFTILVGLSESHISIHTWPERLTVQLDVFLCNYMNDNATLCENIYNEIVDYFDPRETNTTVLERL